MGARSRFARAVSRPSFLGAVRSRTPHRRSRGQGRAVARRWGSLDSLGTRGQPGATSRGERVGGSLPCPRAVHATRSQEWDRLRSCELAQARRPRARLRSVLFRFLVRRVEDSPTAAGTTWVESRGWRTGRAGRDLARLARMATVWIDPAHRAAEGFERSADRSCASPIRPVVSCSPRSLPGASVLIDAGASPFGHDRGQLEQVTPSLL